MFTLVSQTLARTGLLGVFGLMLLENLVPLIPSELILPMAGYQAGLGRFDPLLAVAAGWVGSVAGGCAWWALGRRLGEVRTRRLIARLGRWAGVTLGEFDRALAWFKRRCGLAVLVGRALPGVRGVICLPPGIAGMGFWPFLAWSSAGALVWSALLVGAGLWLGRRFGAVEGALNPVTDLLLAAFVLLYAVRVLRPPAPAADQPGVPSPPPMAVKRPSA